MTFRPLITLITAACLSALPLWADEDALARIEALTEAQSIDLLFMFLSDLSVNCRVELLVEDFADEDIYMEKILESMLTNLQIPPEDHAELSPVLERRVDSFDGDIDSKMNAQLDAMFEIVAQSDERVVLLERNCQVLGS